MFKVLSASQNALSIFASYIWGGGVGGCLSPLPCQPANNYRTQMIIKSVTRWASFGEDLIFRLGSTGTQRPRSGVRGGVTRAPYWEAGSRARDLQVQKPWSDSAELIRDVSNSAERKV